MNDNENMNYDDFSSIFEMTDKQAADILEKMLNWSQVGRQNGKNITNLTAYVAFHRAIKKLRGEP